MKLYANDLFPQMRLYQTYWEQREYVEARLIELIGEGDFSLTAVCNQPDPRSTQLAGEIICGTMVQDKRYAETNIPMEIEEFRVALKPVFGDVIEYEGGWKQVGQLRNKMPMLRKVNRVHQVNKYGIAHLPLKDAWIALHRYGKNVRVAKSERMQAILWRFEEVTPSAVKKLRDEVDAAEKKAAEEAANKKRKAV